MMLKRESWSDTMKNLKNKYIFLHFKEYFYYYTKLVALYKKTIIHLNQALLMEFVEKRLLLTESDQPILKGSWCFVFILVLVGFFLIYLMHILQVLPLQI